MKNLKKESILVFSLVGLAVASRLLPHPPNFAPITGIALFAAANFEKKWLAFLLPLCCLFITDLILGLSWINLFVYGAFALISLIGLAEKIAFPLSSCWFGTLFLYPNLWRLAVILSINPRRPCNMLHLGDTILWKHLGWRLFYTAILFYTFSTLKKTYLKRLKFKAFCNFVL